MDLLPCMHKFLKIFPGCILFFAFFILVYENFVWLVFDTFCFLLLPFEWVFFKCLQVYG